VFADDAYFEALKKSDPPVDLVVDVLVVIDGLKFQNPWNEKKAGDLAGWRWRECEPGAAQYEGTAWVSDADSEEGDPEGLGELVHRIENAYRVWP
jgi:hypothetical protein